MVKERKEFTTEVAESHGGHRERQERTNSRWGGVELPLQVEYELGGAGAYGSKDPPLRGKSKAVGFADSPCATGGLCPAGGRAV
jgi:hypothetical protein